jgi:hypothetical protein
MKKVQGFRVHTMMFAALCMSLVLVGVSPAQSDLSTFSGKFTLDHPIHWGTAVLPSGNYTFGIQFGFPVIVSVRNSRGSIVARVTSGIDNGRTGAGNALLIKEKSGQLFVYSLTLPTLRRSLVYDPELAQLSALEARATETVPVTLAKR